MKTIGFLGIFFFASMVSCNTASVPPGFGCFTFVDQGRTNRLEARDLIIERIDLLDSTKVLATGKLESYNFVEMYNSRSFGKIFRLIDGRLFQPEVNKVCKVRFRYDGLPGVVDRLEYTNTARAGLEVSNVKFNNQPVARQQNNEPVEGCWVFVLQ